MSYWVPSQVRSFCHPTVITPKQHLILIPCPGGTDICSLFAGMNTSLPVYRGEIQCRLPGMAIEAFAPSGEIAGPNKPGELVCLKPFPCQPVGFWPLDGYGSQEAVEAAKVRYQQAYFSEFKGVWCKCHVILYGAEFFQACVCCRLTMVVFYCGQFMGIIS